MIELNYIYIGAGAVAVVCVVAVSWLTYMGLLKKVKITVREIPEITIFNMNFSGSMQDMCKGITYFLEKLKILIPTMTIFPRMGCFYYTMPSQITNPEDNKWSCFYVLNDVPMMLEAAKKLPKSDEYSVITVPKSKALYGSFPHRNNLSYMFGPMKVYSAITKFMNKNSIKSVGCAEIYHHNKDPIEYEMYLEHEELFIEIQNTKFVKANLL